MDIVYSCDDRFVWIMGVSMLSLVENNREVGDICFHVLDGGISSENRKKIILMIDSYGRSCHFYQVHRLVETTITNQKLSRGSYSMFSRLFINQVLSDHLKKILYLDCDTLVLSNLKDFWAIDMEDNVLVAVNDCVSEMHRKQIGLQKEDIYFNSGVLLIDMVRWRKFDIERDIRRALDNFTNLPYPDQCALNIVLSKRTKIIHPKYNILPYIGGFSYVDLLNLRKPSFYYTEQEFYEAVTSPVIVHFATFFLFPRPWIIGHPRNEYYRQWRYYWCISPWKNMPLWSDSRKFRFRMLVILFHLLPPKLAISIAGGLHAWIIPFTGILNRKAPLFIKRFFDVVFSTVILLTVFPVTYVVLGAGIKLNSQGPVFFRQKRTGLYGKVFCCLKFRSMQVNENADTEQSVQGDSRITQFGRFLRKTHLDELPQFINVFRGEMSIVGPRPHMLKHTEYYADRIEGYMLRHEVKPGITGWAQVTGFSGEIRDIQDMEGRVARDIWYIRHQSFLLDIRIIAQTVVMMFRRDKRAY
jgi:lipopolysaccharide/colanic/teichoic acid biosynthesis glycosyltransferase/lipopolysaccharide biosynthesis glycosyltransferase